MLQWSKNEQIYFWSRPGFFGPLTDVLLRDKAFANRKWNFACSYYVLSIYRLKMFWSQVLLALVSACLLGTEAGLPKLQPHGNYFSPILKLELIVSHFPLIINNLLLSLKCYSFP